MYYFVVEKIWINELDDHNRNLALSTQTEFNKKNYSDQELKEKLIFWNQIQTDVFLEETTNTKVPKDSIFTAIKNSPFLPPEVDDNYRVLITNIKINGKPFYFRSVTSFEDTRDTVVALALLTLFFFICIVVGLLVINRRFSKTVWKPFRDTLEKLKNFNLGQQSNVEFVKSDVIEFEELNQSLNQLIDHSISTYKTQKEFAENASHELQTPLAILKNKVDLLLQNDNLTEKQYHIAEDMNKALLRSSRINKNLLLLAKIENNQFDHSEKIDFSELLDSSITVFEEHFDQKKVSVIKQIGSPVYVFGNLSLSEILINNLILNALRHTNENQKIEINLNSNTFEISNPGTEKLEENLLFKRFSKLSSGHKGSGLGLSIVNENCKAQNWKLYYQYENLHHIFSVRF